MARTVEELEADALDLSQEDRTRLFERLLLSFDAPADDEVARAWAEEALRRDEAMESGEEPGVPAEEVFQRLRSTYR